jgi:CcmD family protein
MRRVVAMNSRTRDVGNRGRRRAWALVPALFLAVAIVPAAPSWAGAQPEPVNEFVPIDELPEEDRLPAAPFLITAYSIVWILAFGYFWLLSRRQADVERDLAELARRRPVDEDDDPLEAA